MANALFLVNVYQFNSQDPVPLGSLNKIAFPFAGVMIRGINSGAGQLLSTGVQVYSAINLVATGAVYLAEKTPAALQALS